MAETDPLTFTLTIDASRAVRRAVADGEFARVEDALADALAAWERRHEEREEEMAWIKASVRASLHDPRPSLSLDEVDAHLDAFFNNMEASRPRSDEAA